MRLLLTLAILLSSTLTAQPTKEELATQLSDFITQEMQEQNFPAVSACIVKEGQVVWADAYGTAHIGDGTANTVDTEFALASISKLFTATACVMLADEGLLDLDVDINAYLPITVKNPNHPSVAITTRQLLQHKSSLRDSESDLQLWDAPGNPTIDLPTFCADYFIAGGDLYQASNWGAASPGSASYWYSNAGFTLAGYVIEAASGMSFDAFCQSRILDPLGMTGAGWDYTAVDSTQMAMPYNGAWQPYGYYSLPEYPAAMLKSDVMELAQFLLLYCNGGTHEGEVLIDAASMAQLVPNGMTNGLGWWGTDTWWGDNAGDFWSHGGYMNGVRTILTYYPTDNTGFIILTNGQGSYVDIQNELESYIPLFEASVGCPADIDGNGEVEVNDFLILNSSFGSDCQNCPADLTGDGVVDVTDFIEFNSSFGTVCE